MLIRPVRESDATALLAIYAPMVRETTVSFEEAVPGEEEFRRRVAEGIRTHPWLLAEEGGAVRGYAYAGAWRGRSAYRWSTEVSVYVAPAARRRGVGKALYRALLSELEGRGFVVAYAGITLPNPGSEAFHEELGFRPVATFRGCGRKFGRWLDVSFWERPLAPRGEDPPEVLA